MKLCNSFIITSLMVPKNDMVISSRKYLGHILLIWAPSLLLFLFGICDSLPQFSTYLSGYFCKNQPLSSSDLQMLDTQHEALFWPRFTLFLGGFL